MTCDRNTYLSALWADLEKMWPENAAVNIACHGHSVPAGYFQTPYVNALRAYPHQLREALAERYPFAIVNVIVTAIGGEHAGQGAARFARDVMSLTPRVVTIDYSLNDRAIGLAAAEEAWRHMIEQAIASGSRVVLLTPSWDQSYRAQDDAWMRLCQHADQVRRLADEYAVALCDAFAAFERHVRHAELCELLSYTNHPSALGHALIARELGRWFFP